MQLEIQRKEISSQEQYLETRDDMLQVKRHPVAIEYRIIVRQDWKSKYLMRGDSISHKQ